LPDLFSDAQLEIAVGGADRLVQLAKAQSYGDPTYQAFVAEVKRAANGRVYAILKVAIDITDPNVALAGAVQQYAIALGVYWAWWMGTGGTALPDEVVKAHDAAIDGLKEIVKGQETIGTEQDPATTLGVKVRSIDAEGVRILRKNLGGFC
ncbi:MAG TPA: hypothetical protein VE987_14350, partial [Polyangiaceae bacterium]|nr:hypothetical protein [Polyangiaceae bacterium]